MRDVWKRNARLEVVRGGKKCNMKFLGADVKRPLASVSECILSTRDTSSCWDCRKRTSRQDSNEQEEWRVCGAVDAQAG